MNQKRSPWAWIPTLYFAEGIPYVIVMTLSVIMYKRLGISNTDIAIYTSWLYLPWVIKPFWSPIVDMLKTKRFWIVTMQLLIGAGLAGVAFTIPVPNFFQWTLCFFWLLAFSSATHDIAADGFYLLGLNENQQAFFVGIRSTFYRLAMIFGQGLLIIIAGQLESKTGLPPVKIEFSANQNNRQINDWQGFKNIKPIENKDLYVVSRGIGNQLSLENINKTKHDSIVSNVKEWNISNGFCLKEEVINKKDKSWWTINFSDNLKRSLKEKFGKKVSQSDNLSKKTGNVGLVAFHLSKRPEAGREVVVNITRESGDANFTIKEGQRFVFNDKNWDKSAVSVIQIDQKLKIASTATIQATTGNITLAWSITFMIITILFLLFMVYHKFILPRPLSDIAAKRKEGESSIKEFLKIIGKFFSQNNFGIALLFLLIYRLGESQIVKMAAPFMLDSRDLGGLGLTTSQVGLIYGTLGIFGLTVGGITGGIIAARKGLKFWLWPMAIIMNVPHLVYVFLSYTQPESMVTVASCVIIEQFGYGFGFTAYMLFMIYISRGEHKTAHFALTTAFMALGMMIPGMISGWIQEIVGYSNFFIWVMICSVPIFFILPFIKIEKDFGIKKNE